MIREEVKKVSSGYLMIVVLAIAQFGFAYGIFRSIVAVSVPGLIVTVLGTIVVAICWAGLFMVHPNEAKVLQLFGKYVGTTHQPGLKWANPFFAKTVVPVLSRSRRSRSWAQPPEQQCSATLGQRCKVLFEAAAARPAAAAVR